MIVCMPETPDFSLPPQWVLDLHKPEEMGSFFLVDETDNPNDFTAALVDYHSVNPYTMDVGSEDTLPVKEESRFTITADSLKDLYGKLESLDGGYLLTSRLEKRFYGGDPSIPMTVGFCSAFTVPALVFSAYKGFLQVEKSFKENPDNVIFAHDFINNHPMFWTIREHPTNRRRKSEVVDVITNGGFNKLEFMVGFSDKKTEDGKPKPLVMVETGPGNYHDLNLDVYADSFDAAILETARRISVHYNSHGGFTDSSKEEPNDNFFRD